MCGAARRVRSLAPIAMVPPRHPAAVLALAAALVLAAGAAGCSSGEPLRTPAGTTSTSARPGGGSAPTTGSHGASPSGTAVEQSDARIDRFELRTDLSCVGAADVELPVTYATTDAVAVAFLVDDRQVEGAPPLSGTFDVPLACDGNAHTVILAAVDHDGRAAYESRAVLTSTEARGD